MMTSQNTEPEPGFLGCNLAEAWFLRSDAESVVELCLAEIWACGPTFEVWDGMVWLPGGLLEGQREALLGIQSLGKRSGTPRVSSSSEQVERKPTKSSSCPVGGQTLRSLLLAVLPVAQMHFPSMHWVLEPPACVYEERTWSQYRPGWIVHSDGWEPENADMVSIPPSSPAGRLVAVEVLAVPNAIVPPPAFTPPAGAGGAPNASVPKAEVRDDAPKTYVEGWVVPSADVVEVGVYERIWLGVPVLFEDIFAMDAESILRLLQQKNETTNAAVAATKSPRFSEFEAGGRLLLNHYVTTYFIAILDDEKWINISPANTTRRIEA
ncbi:hypothetical protein BKA70DRAFT_1556960 [Coprinopsis sp. MPI-PUGE-AT-0042]|nr:hypothetical protein BKA70DRAFT_1556960 [Coprinopsis sp. MPI-PUGE-AT-0042]